MLVDSAPAAAAGFGKDRAPRGGFLWLAGDHHIHTLYSSDAMYRVVDHGSLQHAKIGVEKVNPDIVAARAGFKDTLVFQGLEWNIPAAEHGTVSARSRSPTTSATSTARSAPGLLGPAVDPNGRAIDVQGDADPWEDLWSTRRRRTWRSASP